MQTEYNTELWLVVVDWKLPLRKRLFWSEVDVYSTQGLHGVIKYSCSHGWRCIDPRRTPHSPQTTPTVAPGERTKRRAPRSGRGHLIQPRLTGVPLSSLLLMPTFVIIFRIIHDIGRSLPKTSLADVNWNLLSERPR